MLIKNQSFHANGKLLLTGEYFVLDGAQALALPTNLGQSLHIRTLPTQTNKIHWKSTDVDKNTWFEGVIDNEKMCLISSSNAEVAERLLQILRVALNLNPTFLQEKQGLEIETKLEFPREWGLGTSSTLIYTLAAWSNVNPYELLEKTMGGSGYDIACAAAKQAILYQRTATLPIVESINFQPSFKEQLYFVYLGKKQNSRDGIARYRQRINPTHEAIDLVTQLTKETLEAKSMSDFDKIIMEHETLIATLLGLPKAKSLYFQDYFGEIKSLGAWGGDFVLATSQRSPKDTLSYFQNKGFSTILPYANIIL